MFQKMKSCSIFHLKLNDVFLKEKYCDVNVRVRNKDFSCHRVVLASVSEYFDALFGFKEKAVQETTLRDIESETFAEIVKSIYEGRECTFTVNNVHSLLRASLFLGILSMEKSCMRRISPEEQVFDSRPFGNVYIRSRRKHYNSDR